MKRRDERRMAEVLLVEDNEGDVLLVRETLEAGSRRSRLHVARDGLEALAFLQRQGEYSEAPRPDMILLDLNLPRLHGSEVLRQVKTDDQLKSIPVVVLSSSAAEPDVRQSYEYHANCYVTKPCDLDRYVEVMHALEEFWLEIVQVVRD